MAAEDDDAQTQLEQLYKPYSIPSPIIYSLGVLSDVTDLDVLVAQTRRCSPRTTQPQLLTLPGPLGWTVGQQTSWMDCVLHSNTLQPSIWYTSHNDTTTTVEVWKIRWYVEVV
uniref:U4/U6 small nuclear ribonucleoprotein Prp3 n=1 Tax=Lygus hesperus TaxID=30085 RepID=A0A0A9YFH7_LYGHE